MTQQIKIALVGVGMFGGDVHLRAYADLQRAGISPQLARIGLDHWGREFAGIDFELAAVAARSRRSAERAQALFSRYLAGAGGGRGALKKPAVFYGEKPWHDILQAVPDLDLMAVATPDDLHTEVILAALDAGAHVITEKPMCLEIAEADRIIALARRRGRIVAVDMHKRYDPDHLRVRDELAKRIGEPLYGTAYLEEPLAVSSQTFQWVERSDPFSYVGSHWVDLLYHYYRSQPVSLSAVGQKKKLLRMGINAFDAVQVRIEFANGMSIQFCNHWITPPDFEGAVNQGHELVGTAGKIESDQQYRGLRWWSQGGGSRTANTHFTRDVARPDGSRAYVGYGVDSLAAGIAAVCRHKFFGEPVEKLAGIYPNAQDARIVVAIVHAARLVRDLNFKYLQAGKGAPVTARFGADGITIVDPLRARSVFQRVYNKAL